MNPRPHRFGIIMDVDASHAIRQVGVGPPSFHGVEYDRMADDPATPADDAHMFEPHYDRHVWIYRDNPNGVFAPFNPAVTCAHHTGAQSHAMHQQ